VELQKFLPWKIENARRASRVQGSNKQIYWQARYPFPFLKEIKTWSQERLNPLVTALSVKSLILNQNPFRWCGGLMQVMPGTSKWVAEKLICSNTIQKT